MGDSGNAMLAAIAIVSALYHRDKTGEGQAVSTSIVNAGLLHTSYAWIQADGTPGDWDHVDGDQYGLSPFYRMYQGSDDVWLFLAAVSEEDRRRLGALISDLDGVMDDGTKVEEILTATIRSQPAAVSFALLDDGGVPVEIVDELFCRTLFDDEEARRLQLVSETWSGSVGRFEDLGLLVNVSPAEGIVQRGPTMCGEHSREILLEHGFSTEEVDAMVAQGALLEAEVPDP